MSEATPRPSNPDRFALSSLIDALPDAIILADEQGEIVAANTQAIVMFGYAREELVGSLVEMLVPANVREETARFGLPKDEFTDNGHWPQQIYVREARRMVSDFVMTEHHIRNRLVAPNGISLATYPMDIHAVRRVYQDGKLYNEGFGGGGGISIHREASRRPSGSGPERFPDHCPSQRSEIGPLPSP